MKLQTPTWLRAAAGAGEGGPLKQDTVGFLFCLLLFHWRFPIYLSDQVIEDLRQHSKEERKFSRGVVVPSHDPSLSQEGSNHRSSAELIDNPDLVLGKEGLHLGVLTSRTLIFDLAEDSKKAQWFHCLARFWPCSFPTTRSSSKSHLFPTRIIGTWRPVKDTGWFKVKAWHHYHKP